MRLVPCLPFQGVALAVVLGLLAGCEDPDARAKAAAAEKALTDLRGEIAKLENDVKAAKDRAASVEENLTARVTKRMDEINASVLAAQETILKKISDNNKDIGENVSNQLKSTRDDFDARLKKRIEQDVAESFTKIRAEIQTYRDDLLGFMDKQLKELYPYAYQPKRVDPNEPPKAPQP